MRSRIRICQKKIDLYPEFRIRLKGIRIFFPLGSRSVQDRKIWKKNCLKGQHYYYEEKMLRCFRSISLSFQNRANLRGKFGFIYLGSGIRKKSTWIQNSVCINEFFCSIFPFFYQFNSFLLIFPIFTLNLV